MSFKTWTGTAYLSLAADFKEISFEENKHQAFSIQHSDMTATYIYGFGLGCRLVKGSHEGSTRRQPSPKP